MVTYFAKHIQIWLKNRIIRAFIVCGRHSLLIYTSGVILAHLAALSLRWLDKGPLIVLLVIVDALILQLLFAVFLESRRLSEMEKKM